MSRNYLVWGAIGAILFMSIAILGRTVGVEMPIGIRTMSLTSMVIVGFFWGVVVCLVRNSLNGWRHG